MSTIVSPFSQALDNKTFLATYLVVASATSEAGSTFQKLVYTGASVVVRRGDVISFRSGAFVGYEIPVSKIAGNSITLGNSLPSDIGVGVVFDVLRYRTLQVDSDGKLRVLNTEVGTDGTPNYYSSILGLFSIPTCQIGDPNTANLAGISGGAFPGDTRNGIQVVGNVAHDAVDSGGPIKMGGIAASSLPAAVAAADRVNAYFDLNGRQFITSDTLASEVTVTGIASRISTQAALADSTPNPTIGSYGAFPFMWDSGTSRWNRVTGTIANGIDVDVTRVTGTVTISGTVTASNTAGNVAHDAVDSGNPVKMGVKSRTAHVTAVANNDRSDRTGDTLGFAGVTLARNGRADTFTTTANGTTLGDGFQNWKYFSLSVRQTGVVTSWTVVLEYSLDNVVFTTFLTHTNIIGTSIPVFSVDAIPRPVYYMRARCTAIVLGAGTNVISTIIGVQ